MAEAEVEVAVATLAPRGAWSFLLVALPALLFRFVFSFDHLVLESDRVG